MISKYFIFALLLFASLAAFNVHTDSDLLSPKTRVVQIKPITESIIDVLPGRAVKFIFPWILDDDGGEIPFLVTMSNDVYFNKPVVKPGHNVLVMTYKHIDKNMHGEVTDLLISSRGYHFSFTLKANFKPSLHYSTVLLEMAEADKILLLDKELEKVHNILIEERARLEADLDNRAKGLALGLVGGLSIKNPVSTAVKEEAEKMLTNGDAIIAYVDRFDNFGVFTNFVFEVENETNKSIYIKDVRIASSDESGNKTMLPSTFLVDPKLAPDKTALGTVSTVDFFRDSNIDNVLIVSTDQGDIEVIF
ncbi:MAG: hypothetical protein GY820_43465 [Gammaproteobacteria bacterium]|nr:hypothetical protein [Gammaproteobacteria bacterium]